jgi:hypothetical protein
MIFASSHPWHAAAASPARSCGNAQHLVGVDIPTSQTAKLLFKKGHTSHPLCVGVIGDVT